MMTFKTRRSESLEQRLDKLKEVINSKFKFDVNVHMNLTSEEKEKLDQLRKYEKYLWFVDVGKLISGDSCGEFALLYDQKRAATIKCITKCYFATLCK